MRGRRCRRRDERGRPRRPDCAGRAMADLETESEIAADYIEGLLDVADLDGDIDMDVEGERAFVSVVGATLDELVGSRGEVLEALQELTRLAVHRQTGNRTRMMLDVGGYRQRRRTELAETGRDAADEVKRTGQPKRLWADEPVRAQDRARCGGRRGPAQRVGGRGARPPRRRAARWLIDHGARNSPCRSPEPPASRGVALFGDPAPGRRALCRPAGRAGRGARADRPGRGSADLGPPPAQLRGGRRARARPRRARRPRFRRGPAGHRAGPAPAASATCCWSSRWPGGRRSWTSAWPSSA